MSEIHYRPDMKHLVSIPNWLGGGATARWILKHRWALWLVVKIFG